MEVAGPLGTPLGLDGADVIMTEIKYTINVMHLNHPETIPSPPVSGKLSSKKPVPSTKKGWGPLLYGIPEIEISKRIDL